MLALEGKGVGVQKLCMIVMKFINMQHLERYCIRVFAAFLSHY